MPYLAAAPINSGRPPTSANVQRVYILCQHTTHFLHRNSSPGHARTDCQRICSQMARVSRRMDTSRGADWRSENGSRWCRLSLGTRPRPGELPSCFPGFYFVFHSLCSYTFNVGSVRGRSLCKDRVYVLQADGISEYELWSVSLVFFGSQLISELVKHSLFTPWSQPGTNGCQRRHISANLFRLPCRGVGGCMAAFDSGGSRKPFGHTSTGWLTDGGNALLLLKMDLEVGMASSPPPIPPL